MFKRLKQVVKHDLDPCEVSLHASKRCHCLVYFEVDDQALIQEFLVWHQGVDEGVIEAAAAQLIIFELSLSQASHCVFKIAHVA